MQSLSRDQCGVCFYLDRWIWPFETTNAHRSAFKALLIGLTNLKMKPIMAYGGYDAILLCHKDISYRMYGVAQSVGYGENRAVTPVGGGLPVNKYYFYPLHDRLKMSDTSSILKSQRFFSMDPQRRASYSIRQYVIANNAKASSRTILIILIYIMMQ